MHCIRAVLLAFGVVSGPAKTPLDGEDARPRSTLVPYAMAGHRMGERRVVGSTSEQDRFCRCLRFRFGLRRSAGSVGKGNWTLLYHERARNGHGAIRYAYNRRDSCIIRLMLPLASAR